MVYLRVNDAQAIYDDLRTQREREGCLYLAPASDVTPSLWEELERRVAAGIPTVRLHEIDDKPWGLRQFSVIDMSGNAIRVGQRRCHLRPGVGASMGVSRQAGGVASHRPLYEDIGRTYSRTRREDPRIAAEIAAGLGPGRSVVNVGAGTGNYEPRDRAVVAVEPSLEMLQQRRERARRVVRAVAEALPFPDDAFDTGLAVLTIHHWTQPEAGLRELRRVSRRQVVFFFEPLRSHDFWAVDYFPEALEVPSEQDPPSEEVIRRVLRVQDVRPVLVPHDCVDGFGAAFWARPEAYLDPQVQAGMSWLALLAPEARQRGSERLSSDLASGAWDRRHGYLRRLPTYDGGYRLAIAH